MVDPEDDELARIEEELRSLVNVLDPVPDAVHRAAEAGFAWRNVDEELASLRHDPLVDDVMAGAGGAVLLRSAGEPHLLSFEHATVTIEVEITAGPGGYELTGQLVPAGPGTVQVRQPGRVVDLTADELGRFGAEGLSGGPVSLWCHRGTGSTAPPVVTEWVSIRSHP